MMLSRRPSTIVGLLTLIAVVSALSFFVARMTTGRSQSSGVFNRERLPEGSPRGSWVECLGVCNEAEVQQLAHDMRKDSSLAAAIVGLRPANVYSREVYGAAYEDGINRIVVAYLSQPKQCESIDGLLCAAVASRLDDVDTVAVSHQDGLKVGAVGVIITRGEERSESIRIYARRWLVHRYGVDHEFSKDDWMSEVFLSASRPPGVSRGGD